MAIQTGATDLVALDPREARRIGAESLIGYGKLFFPTTFRQRNPSMHETVGRALYSPFRYNAFEMFRGSAKTTLLRTFNSQRIAYAISRTIMYVSVSQFHASLSVRWIKKQVEYNKRWTSAFGLEKGSKWTDEWAEIRHGVEEVPITLLAAGITGQIRGFNVDDFRPDLIIIDDVLNDENTATPDQRKKVEELLFGALLNSLAPTSEAPWAKAVFLQTPFHREDAIEKCMQDPQWNPIRFGVFDERGESRWPERFSTEQLLADKQAHIRRSQYRLWMREMECKLVSGEDKAINVQMLRYWEILPELLDVVISIDPASSDSPTADDFAIAVLGFSGTEVFLLDYKLSKGTMPDKAAADFFHFVMLYSPRKACVETVAYQKILKWYLEQEMLRRRIFIPIDEFQDRRSKATRIMQAIPGYVAYGHFWIHPRMTEFVTQADDYDPQVKEQPDDLLDAISSGITCYNPALRTGLTLEGDYRRLELDESRYPALNFRGKL